MKLVTPADEPLRSVSLRVLKGEETLQEVALDEEQLADANDLAEDMTDEQRRERVQTAQFLLVFSPIQFDRPCTLRVLAQTEDGELRGIALKVQASSPDSTQAGPDS